METPDRQTEASTIAELARLATAPQVMPDGTYIGDTFVLGGELVDLERYRAAPRQIKALVELFDIDSLAEYVDRHRGPGTTAYFDTRLAVHDESTPTLDVVLRDDLAGQPSWRRHSAFVRFPYSEDWKRWTGCDRQAMTQDDFATFLEDNMLAVTEPVSAELLELVTKFEETRTVTFKSSKRLQNGERAVVYTDETAHDQELRMPDQIGLALTVFEARDAADPFPVRARLRYRVQSGALSLWYELIRPDLVRKVALEDVRAAFLAATEHDEHEAIPVLLGIWPGAR